MKVNSIIRLTLVVILPLFTTIALSQTTLDTTTIQSILQEEIVSWNNGDAITYSKHFAADGTFTNILGMYFTGHKAFLERHVEIFNGRFSKTKLEQKTVSLKFIRPDVAVVETLTWVSGFSKEGPPQRAHLDDKGRLCTRLLQVMVKNENDWQIMTYHNVDLKPGTVIPK